MTYREAVLTISDNAKKALPQSISRIEKAVQLVLNGHVEVVDSKYYRVSSQQDGKTVHHLANGTCTCVDFTSGKAPQGLCKHRLAGNIHRKALDMIKTQEPVGSLGEAPCSANTRLMLGGREIQLTLRDSDETRLLGRLEQVLAKFAVEAPSVDQKHQDKSFCSLHHITMTKKHGKYGEFYSHQTQSGWCTGGKGKGR
jgi:hypothetical protein